MRDGSAQTVLFPAVQTVVSGLTECLTQSRCTDVGWASPSADLIMAGVRQDIHKSTSFDVTGMTQPGVAGKNLRPDAQVYQF